MGRSDSPGIVDGGLVRSLTRLVWPILVIQTLKTSFTVTDMFWLGHESPEAVAAISLVTPFIFLLMALIGGITTGGSILLAQHVGAENATDADRVTTHTLVLVVILAVIVSLLHEPITQVLVELFSITASESSRATTELTVDYFEIILIGSPLVFFFSAFWSLMRGYGNTKIPMWIFGVAATVNAVVDPVLIFGWWNFPRLGVEGAAYAAVFSRGIGATMGLLVLSRSQWGPRPRAEFVGTNWPLLRKILEVGVPNIVERGAIALGFIGIALIVSMFPPTVIAAYGIGNKIGALAFLPALGLGLGVNTMVGQNVGAGQIDRAKTVVVTATKIGVVFLAVLAILTVALAKPISRVFIATAGPTAQATIGQTVTYLRISAVEYVFFGIMQVYLGGFRGAGNTKVAMGLSVIALFGFSVPAVYVLGIHLGWGAIGVWIGTSIEHVIGSLLAVVLFTRLRWDRSLVDSDGHLPEDS